MASVMSTAGFRAPNRTADALDTILKGLAIAEKGYGLVTASEDKEMLRRQQEMQNEQKERQIAVSEQAGARAEQTQKSQRAGELTPTEIIGLRNKGVQLEPLPSGPLSTGQFEIRSTTGERFAASPAIKPPNLNMVTTVGPGGVSMTKGVTDEELARGVVRPPPQPRVPTPRIQLRNELQPDGSIGQVAHEVSPGDVLPEESIGSKEIRRDVRNLQKDTEPTRATLSNIEIVEKALGFDLDDYDSATKTIAKRDADGNITREPIDVAGVSLPLFGRTAFGDKAQDLKSKIARVFNIELKSRSGAAVTDTELTRLREEFGEGVYSTEPLMLDALKRYRELALQTMRSHEGAYDPLVLKAYSEREDTLTSRSFSGGPKDAETASKEDLAAELLRRRRNVSK